MTDMTRTQHYSHPTQQFPVYCLDWADDGTVILGGGGGATKSGIANKLKLCRVSPDGRRVELDNEIALSSDEDAPMTMALDRASSQLVTGINASDSSIQAGKNPQCRLFSYADKQLAFVRSQQTINALWSDDFPYQKMTSLSTKEPGEPASYVAVGTTDNMVAVLRFPSLEMVVAPFTVDGGDLVDVNWGGPGGAWLAVTTASLLEVYNFTAETDEKPRLDLIESIPAPKMDDTTVQFRGARFSPDPLQRDMPAILAIFNSTMPPRREMKKLRRAAYVGKYEATEAPSQDSDEQPTRPHIKWELAIRREVASKPITVFDVSSDGRLLSFGCSDLSIGMMDAKTLAPLLKILQAHSFPPTALKFNPSGSMLISASADNTVRTVVVPASFGASVPAAMSIALIIALAVLLLAILMRK